MDSKLRKNIVDDIITLINEKDANIMSKLVLDLAERHCQNRRWYDKYDKYPDVWMLYNILPYLDDVTLNNITVYLNDKFANIKKGKK